MNVNVECCDAGGVHVFMFYRFTLIRTQLNIEHSTHTNSKSLVAIAMKATHIQSNFYNNEHHSSRSSKH